MACASENFSNDFERFDEEHEGDQLLHYLHLVKQYIRKIEILYEASKKKLEEESESRNSFERKFNRERKEKEKLMTRSKTSQHQPKPSKNAQAASSKHDESFPGADTMERLEIEQNQEHRVKKTSPFRFDPESFKSNQLKAVPQKNKSLALQYLDSEFTQESDDFLFKSRSKKPTKGKENSPRKPTNKTPFFGNAPFMPAAPSPKLLKQQKLSFPATTSKPKQATKRKSPKTEKTLDLSYTARGQLPTKATGGWLSTKTLVKQAKVTLNKTDKSKKKVPPPRLDIPKAATVVSFQKSRAVSPESSISSPARSSSHDTNSPLNHTPDWNKISETPSYTDQFGGLNVDGEKKAPKIKQEVKTQVDTESLEAAPRIKPEFRSSLEVGADGNLSDAHLFDDDDAMSSDMSILYVEPDPNANQPIEVPDFTFEQDDTMSSIDSHRRLPFEETPPPPPQRDLGRRRKKTYRECNDCCEFYDRFAEFNGPTQAEEHLWKCPNKCPGWFYKRRQKEPPRPESPPPVPRRPDQLTPLGYWDLPREGFWDSPQSK